MTRAGRPQASIVTDLDGTLLHRGEAHPRALATLRQLPERGVLRVAATGRSLASYRGLPFAEEAPLDVLVFSSGAGVLDLRGAEQRLWRSTALTAADAARARDALQREGLDFMVHPPVPAEHRFAYRPSDASEADRERNPDFWRRIEVHRGASRRLEPSESTPEASALLAVVPAREGAERWTRLREALGQLTVLRTTSPLDHRSTWIEIFPRSVSKSQTSAWVAAELAIPRERTLCLGNDYNDLDLLAWGGAAVVTRDAPEALRERYPTMPPAREGGVAEAVARWLAALPDRAG